MKGGRASSALAGLLCAAAVAVCAGRLGAQDGFAGPVEADGTDGCARAKAARAAGVPRAGPAKHTVDAGHQRTDVRHYRIELELQPGAQTLAGSTSIRVASRVQGLEGFRLWLAGSLAISAVEVDGRSVHWSRAGSVVDIDLGRGFDVGEVFTVVVTYAGTPGPSSWYTASQNGSPVVSTLSQPWFASDWWAAKDDNGDKATGDLLITVPEELTVVANGVLRSVSDVVGDRRRFHWSTGYPTSPYLFAFSATAYTTFSETFISGDEAMPVEFFIYPASDTPANRSGWRSALDMLATFEALFGPYPFKDEKYAIYEFPFGGGMEHQTATGQGGRYAFSEALTAHELAHQWWGDLVTCATWHDVWLNEGFATYATALWYEFASGVQDADSGRAYLESRRPAELDGTVYVDDVTDPRRIFSGTYSYNKAAWVLHMLRGAVGDDAFFEILAAYRERHAYATATTADFQAVAETIVGRELDWFFDRWIFDGGAPAYAFGWREHEVGGRRWLELSVEQTQSEARFTMPIQLAIEVLGEPRVETVWNDARVQHYLLPVAGPVDDVVLDPDRWLLTRSVTRSAFTAGPPRLLAVDPGPGATLPAGQPLNVRLTFHEDVVIAPTDLVLRRQGGAVLPVDVVYDRQNLTAVVSSRQPLAGGGYELVVADSIVDAESGLAFDGELDAAAALPSGDGVPGGAAVIELEVTGIRRSHGRRSPVAESALLAPDLSAPVSTDR